MFCTPTRRHSIRGPILSMRPAGEQSDKRLVYTCRDTIRHRAADNIGSSLLHSIAVVGGKKKSLSP